MDRNWPLTDLELLTALCSEQDDDLLYTEFVNRFHKEVKEECIRICNHRKLDPHVGQQIANEVFEKLRRYKSFKETQIKVSSPHKGILVYLFRIVRNLFTDWHNKEKKAHEPYVGRSYFDELTESLEPPEGVEMLLWKKETSMKILKSLNQKEMTVLITDLEHKKQQRYLPDEINEMLAEKLAVKKSSIRKIRERGIEKIKKAINEINQQ